MLSQLNFKKQSTSIFRLAKADGLNVKVAYKSYVYIVNIIKTNERYDWYAARKGITMKPKKGAIELKTSKCKVCGSVEIANICVSKSCETNQKNLQSPTA